MSYGIDIAVDAHAATGSVRRLCANKGLTVHFDLDPGHMPYTTGKTIHVEKPKANWTKEAWSKWWGTIAHEIKHAGHERGKEVFNVLAKFGCDCQGNIIDGMYNLIEDGIVDNLGRNEFLGMDESADWCRFSMSKEEYGRPDMMKHVWKNPELGQEGIFVSVCSLLSNKARGTWQKPMYNFVDEFLEEHESTMNPEICRKLQTIIDAGEYDKLVDYQNDPNGHTSEDIYRFVRHLAETYFDIPEQPTGSNGNPGEGKGKGEEKDPEQGEGGAGGGAGEGEVSEKESEADKVRKTLFEHIAREDTHLEEQQERAVPSGAKVEYPETAALSYEPADSDKFMVVDFPRRTVKDVAGGITSVNFEANFDYEEEYFRDEFDKKKQHYRDRLPNDVKRYIQSETRTKRRYNKKRGKLDSKRLYRLGVEDADDDYKEKVFVQVDNRASVKQTAVSLLVDCSGSMFGTAYTNAILAMDVLGDVCNALDINYEMAGFTTYGRYDAPCHFLFKPFGVKVPRQDTVTSMIKAGYCLRNNADGENILLAYRRLLDQRKAKRRVLIVLSDGYPACHGGDIDRYTKEVTNYIQDQGLVELHGIGLEDRAVQRFYKSHTIINDVSELDSKLLSMLKQSVIKFN